MNPVKIFQCIRCGDCCRGYGGTFVSREDIERIAAYVGMDVKTFVESNCRFSGGKPLLAQGADGFCVFYTDRCAIHSVKPRMCRAWPYLDSVLIDVRNWQMMASVCPGMRTDLPDRVILECVRRKLQSNRTLV